MTTKSGIADVVIGASCIVKVPSKPLNKRRPPESGYEYMPRKNVSLFFFALLWSPIDWSNLWTGHDLYRKEAVDDLHRFFDFYAKNIQNGWEKETPRVRLSLLGYDGSLARTIVERPECQWPPARQRTQKFYLDAASKSIVREKPSASSTVSYESHSLSDSSVSSARLKIMVQINQNDRISNWSSTSTQSSVVARTSSSACPVKRAMIWILWFRFANAL